MRKSRTNSFRSDPQINWEQCGYRAANLIHFETSDDKASNLPTVSNWIFFCLILLSRNKEHNYKKTMPLLLEIKHFSSPTYILSHWKFQAKQLCNWISKEPQCTTNTDKYKHSCLTFFVFHLTPPPHLFLNPYLPVWMSRSHFLAQLLFKV